MTTYTHTFPLSDMISPCGSNWDFYPYNEYSPNEICFFDIETTGLSADTANIYLIGAGYYEDESFDVIQWFADDYNSEKDMLINFMEFLNSYKVIMHYNGSSFDIPFIQKKCRYHSVSCEPLAGLKSVDLYTSLRKYAALLNLPNKKLKSFEKYVGFCRNDTSNGGELINVYAEYMQNTFIMQNATCPIKENEMLLKMMLLHNCEDITGLSQVASLLFLKDLNKLSVTVKDVSYSDEDSYLKVEYVCRLPGNYNFSSNIPIADTDKVINFSFVDDRMILTIPVFMTTLNYYFTDYKDYYYMTEEHTVMHKSIAIYADSSVRRKAKKSECFVSKEGLFLPVIKSGCFSSDRHIFRKNYTSKDYFIEYDEKMLSDTEWLITYYRQLFDVKTKSAGVSSADTKTAGTLPADEK